MRTHWVVAIMESYRPRLHFHTRWEPKWENTGTAGGKHCRCVYYSEFKVTMSTPTATKNPRWWMDVQRSSFFLSLKVAARERLQLPLCINTLFWRSSSPRMIRASSWYFCVDSRACTLHNGFLTRVWYRVILQFLSVVASNQIISFSFMGLKYAMNGHNLWVDDCQVSFLRPAFVGDSTGTWSVLM